MKNKLLILLTVFSTFLIVSCKKDPMLTGYVYAMDMDLVFLDQNGFSLFANNQLLPVRNAIEVTYVINDKPVDFYSIKATLEHSLVPFLYYEDTGKKIIHLFMNGHLTDNKSTTIIKLKGFPADTLYGEFYIDEHSTILKKCTVNNGPSYVYGEVITLVK